jgi:amidase
VSELGGVVSELWQMQATDLAGLVAVGDVTAAEVIESHLERIEAVNPAVNAVVRVLADEARTAAKEIDRARAAGEVLGPLAGVPVTVKENIDLAGSPTTCGLSGLADAVAPGDAPVVERLRSAGAIPIARTNLPDMGLRIHTHSGLHGLTRNPWDAAVTTGGSSGGDAAALATGMSAIGLGNDLGGSLRNPASCCGIASIKPSAGRVPHAAYIPAEDEPPVFQAFAVQGPMARRTADVRLALGVLAGPHPRDPFSIPIQPTWPTIDRPIEVAVVARPPGGSTDQRVVDRVLAAATALRDAGLSVTEVTPPRYEEVLEVWSDLVFTDIRAMLPVLEPLLSDDARTFLHNVLDAAPALDLDGYVQAWMRRQSLARAWARFFTEHDVVLSPTWTQLPFACGWDVDSTQGSLDAIELLRPVMPANALGLPSACVPAGLVDGVPVGALVTGPMYREDLCLDVAEVIEAALAPAVPIDPA